MSQVSTFTASQLAKTSWALAKVGYGDEALLNELAQASRRKLSDLDGQGVANLVWSFTTLSFREQPILDAVAARCVACSMSDFNQQGMANLC